MHSLSPHLLTQFAVLIFLLSAPAQAQQFTWDPGRTTFPTLTEINDAKAQPAAEAKSSKPRAQRPDSAWLINAIPKAEPARALGWRLFLHRLELKPGKTSVPIMRALVSLKDFDNHPQVEQLYADNEEAWVESELSEMPTEEIKEYLANYRFALEQLHEAVYLREVGYRIEMDGRSGAGLIYLLLPEYQNLRALARILRLEARLAIKEKRYDHALEAIRAGYRLAEFACDSSDFIIAELIGIAIQSYMRSAVAELIEQPDTPNMYWALASLPDQLLGIRESIEAESYIFTKFLPLEGNVRNKNLTADGWRDALVSSVHQMLQIEAYVGDPPSDDEKADQTVAKLIASALIAAYSDTAKKWLIDRGENEQEVNAMSPAHAICIQFAEEGLEVRDSYFKWTLLPGSLLSENAGQFSRVIDESSTRYTPVDILSRLLLPAIHAVNEAEMRTRQQNAMLINAEALRAHAAANDGKLPATLSECEPLPAWDDPRTGEPFEYRRISDYEAEIVRAISKGRDHQSTLRIDLNGNAN